MFPCKAIFPKKTVMFPYPQEQRYFPEAETPYTSPHASFTAEKRIPKHTSVQE